MLEFAWPWMFLAVLLPWLVRRLLPPATITHHGVLFAPFTSAYEEQNTTAFKRLPLRSLRTLAVLLCWLLLVTAAARPQWLGKETELPETGRKPDTRRGCIRQYGNRRP